MKAIAQKARNGVLFGLVLLTVGRSVAGADLESETSNAVPLQQQAEAGDPAAQVQVGSDLLTKAHTTEAAAWFTKAAEHGYVEAEYQLGHLLLHGKGVQFHPQPSQGIQWMFAAATNRCTRSYLDMSAATQEGLATPKDLVASFAWLSWYCEYNPSFRVHLKNLSHQLDPEETKRSEVLLARYKAGNWGNLPIQTPFQPIAISIRQAPVQDVAGFLRLDSVFAQGLQDIATINGQVVGEGETIQFVMASGMRNVECLKIKRDSVEILIEGDTETRTLSLKEVAGTPGTDRATPSGGRRGGMHHR